MTPDEAHRRVLDHLLALIAGSEVGAGLVLRGSMTLQAWLGDRARPPGDLDWIVPELSETSFPDPLDPFPYLDDIATVQQWPAAVEGAAEYQMWAAEEFGTFGIRPLLPPEGLRWMRVDEYTPSSLRDTVVESIRRNPHVAGGMLWLDADDVDEDGQWAYAGYDTLGMRLLVPWYTADDREAGEVRLDFASDETIPDTPVWTAIPRADGGQPTPVVTASRELSLAWKLLWLHVDATDKGHAAGKDLYDAVLLAESERTHLTPRLLRKVLGPHAHGFGPDAIRRWQVNWTEFCRAHPSVRGGVDSWLDRLARALPIHPRETLETDG
ncbi:nucleotidyl transferase AbiEii/AbiGii toxin family protein [Nocardia sp. GCM10030253]|uniref:nucleotidyl transferase AbiEii/AbiGii toxin family protein n=1 Tax=Nocardia sp. GCM10030253 TaxID=3273404 RepID=UPI003641740F